MLRLQITPEQVERYRHQLRAAGSQEIGGVLVGEHVAEDVFRLIDFSVQHSGGTASCFVRRPEDHEAFLEAFFASTQHRYRQFNYLGEWHSHPSFPAWPSSTDVGAMQALVEDATQGANFAVLMVVNLDWCRRLCVSATAFQPSQTPSEVDVSLIGPPQSDGWFKRLSPRRKVRRISR